MQLKDYFGAQFGLSKKIQIKISKTMLHYSIISEV